MSSATNTQITLPKGYNASNIIFEKTRELPVPGPGNLTYKRINIGTKNPDRNN